MLGIFTIYYMIFVILFLKIGRILLYIYVRIIEVVKKEKEYIA